MYVQRKYLPTGQGEIVLERWMEESPNKGVGAARWAHISKYHRQSSLGFFARSSPIAWMVGTPFVLGRAAVRLAGQQGKFCPLCQLRNGQPVDLSRYLDRVAPAAPPNPSPRTTPVEIHRCPACQGSFVSHEFLVLHHQKNHGTPLAPGDYQERQDSETMTELDADPVSAFGPAPEVVADLESQTSSSQEVEVGGEYKICPDCAEQVRLAARKCRFCGYMFDQS